MTNKDSKVARDKPSPMLNGAAVGHADDVKFPSLPAGSWGRIQKISWINSFFCTAILAVTPVSVFWTYASCAHYRCSLSGPLYDPDFGWDKALPAPTVKGGMVYAGWIVFQGLLYALLPGRIGYGQRTPAGYLLPYKVFP